MDNTELKKQVFQLLKEKIKLGIQPIGGLPGLGPGSFLSGRDLIDFIDLCLNDLNHAQPQPDNKP